MNQLFNGDCLSLMQDIPSASIDMILCDLPYGTTACKWDSVIPFDELWKAYNRIIKDNGAIVLFGSEPFTSFLVCSQIKLFRYDLIWDKTRGCDFLRANQKPLKSHENILVFGKEMPRYNKQYWFSSPYKAAHGNRKKSSVYYGSAKTEDSGTQSESIDGERNPLSILPFARDSSRVHPTQKPVALLEWLVKTYTNAGDTVLDNCMGSGSTGVACVNTGRNFIGLELDPVFFEIAKRRIDGAFEQMQIEI